MKLPTTNRRHVLTPDALLMVDAIARNGSFAAAARELGKAPSALTYCVRQFEAFCGLCDGRDGTAVGAAPSPERSRPGTRLRLRSDVLAGTWEALMSGQVDLAIGVKGDLPNPGSIELRPLGTPGAPSTAAVPAWAGRCNGGCSSWTAR